MGVCVLKIHNTVSRYIMTWPIMDLCEEAVRRSEEWVAMRWRNREELELSGARESAATSAYDG